jgi:hypothetical protein
MFCFGSGTALDPDSMTLWIRIELKCWNRIRTEVNPDKNCLAQHYRKK